MTDRNVPFAYAEHPKRGWLLIPAAWFGAYEKAGATLYRAPEGTEPVDQPTSVSGPPSGLTALEGDGSGSKNGAEPDPFPATDPNVRAKAARMLAEHDRRTAPGPRDQTFIAPNFRVEPTAPKRCSSCSALYPPRPRGDRGLCAACTRNAVVGAR